MFPIRDDNPHFLTPWVTYGLIAANVWVWFAFQGLGAEGPLADSVCRLGFIPGELLQQVAVGTQVSLAPGHSCAIGPPDWRTPLTSMFLHGSFGHILGNMWFLWIFGNNVEDSMGHTRFVFFYVLSGFVAAVAQAFSDPASAVPMVGASGAIGGVMGAYVVLYPRVNVHMLVFPFTFAVPAIFMLGYWFAVQLLSGFVSLGGGTGGVAFWAHVGGFAAGAVLILFFRDPALVRRHPYYGWTRRRLPTRTWRRV